MSLADNLNDISFVRGMLATVLMGTGGYFIYDWMFDPIDDVLPGYSYYSKTDNLNLEDVVSAVVAGNMDGQQEIEIADIEL